jgi:hypothetical protein
LHFERKELPIPERYIEDVSLFRAMWTLHRGELFGTVGKTDALRFSVSSVCVTKAIRLDSLGYSVPKAGYNFG